MSAVLITLLVLGALAVLFFVMFMGLYNGLVRARNKVKESWAQIDVQLKRRYDLIPNLVETVKGYLQHEKEVLENIAKARAGLISGQPREAAAADAQLSRGLNTLFAVAENYPDLKANTNFVSLQGELTETENAIAYARQGYNAAVLQYNNKVEMLPTNIVAAMFHFEPAEFFEVDSEEERKAVKVKF
ncbi:MAG: LemA family protein [Planctomycetota bacterium]|nr:MAG: LemA family protein [Planctomycetota bacterium]